MANLAIKGHATRGKEVIEILEMLGGENKAQLKGTDTALVYYIYPEGYIDTLYMASDKYYKVFTLDEFLEKFPYKVGDKVLRKPYVGARQICEMRWDSDDNCIKYGIGVGEWFNVSQVQPYKEETMEELIIDTIKESEDRYRIKVNYQFDIEVDEGEYYAVRRKLQYPKTYEECCAILEYPHNVVGGYKAELLSSFQNLLICRDAYWKIAGWNPKIKGEKFYMNSLPSYLRDLFPMPTEEMRDAFLENFRELIELVKELL